MVYLFSRIWKPENFTKIDNIKNFYEDVKNNSLSQFTFLEPKFIGENQNDMHPPTNILNGDNLLGSIYVALIINSPLTKML
jgi:phospholipase C